MNTYRLIIEHVETRREVVDVDADILPASVMQTNAPRAASAGACASYRRETIRR